MCLARGVCVCVCVSPEVCVWGGASLREGDLQSTSPLDTTSPRVSLRSSNTQDTPPVRAGMFCTRTVSWGEKGKERERERERERKRE